MRKKLSTNRKAVRQREFRKNEPKKYRAIKRKSVKKHWDRVRKWRLKRHKGNPARNLFQQAKTRARKTGMKFTIKRSDVVIPDACPVLGIPLFIQGGTRTDNSPTIDRIDNRGGYTRGNIVVVSWRANRIKVDASIEELIKVAKFYGRFL